MSVKFKCKRSGNEVTFSIDGDIEAMRKHEGYTEVIDAQTPKAIEVEQNQATPEEVLTPKRGRPSKVAVPSFLQE